MVTARKEARSLPGSTSHTQRGAVRSSEKGWSAPGSIRVVGRRFMSASVSASAEGFGPFPVQKLQSPPAVGIEYAGRPCRRPEPRDAGHTFGICAKPPPYIPNPGKCQCPDEIRNPADRTFPSVWRYSKLEVGVELPFLYRYTGVMSGISKPLNGQRPGSRRRAAHSAMSTMSTTLRGTGSRSSMEKRRAGLRRQHGAGQISTVQGDLRHAGSFASDGDQTSDR